MDDRRPTPEDMLRRAAAEATQAARGRLKIFFGAAPGVGKTYAMLESAQARRREGVDVVLGWVDTHGRRETEALTEGLEHIPPRVVDYRGVTLREFDLDAALARRPGLLLVDELPHTNAEGSRHARRWQDIEELLQAGIQVHTTLNVQHLEGLNDVVAMVTGVAVTETVPDSIFDSADEVEFVDLPPDDLLHRLRAGKVTVRGQTETALEYFFRKGNLISLRELALRRTAERVDAQARAWRQSEGSTRPTPALERVLVAIGPAPQSANLIRAAYRTATRLRAPWIALSVETPALDRLPAADRERVAEHLALAQRLGADPLVVRGESVADEILAVARERRVTRILVGKPRGSRFRRSVVDALVRAREPIDVLVTTGDPEHPPERQPLPRGTVRAQPRDYGLALALVGVVTVLCLATRPVFNFADQAMLYLAGVVVAAGRMPRGPSLFATVASVAALDFFFVPPFLTFAVADLRYAVTFAVMLGVGFVVNHLTHRIRQQAEAARQRERRTASLYALSRDFLTETEVDEIAATAVQQIRDFLDAEVVLFLDAGDGTLTAAAGADAEIARSENERAVARWVFVHGEPAGFDTDTLPGAAGLFLPLTGTRGTLGVLGAALNQRPPLSPSQRQLLETFVAQTALVIERAQLGEEAARARVRAETEHTRSTLLAGVSHDLRTPLASITGAAEALLDQGPGPDAAGRRELLATIRDEATRLVRLVENLLELTRLESGALQLHKEWVPVEEIVSSALGARRAQLTGRIVRVDLPSNMLVAPVDPVLLEQVLVNLIENALKYSPEGSPIDLAARSEGSVLHVEVADRGPGVRPGDETRVFEKFYRAPDGARTGGTGLGLAVCHAIVKAHGGAIEAAARPGGGAVFRFTLPIEGTPPSEKAPLFDVAPGATT